MSTENQYDTLVVEGMGNTIPQEIGGLRVAAWHRGHALDAKCELEDFIRKLSYGDFEDPEQAAVDLMERMNWA
ncbi:hypothetical protein BLL42_23745 [Pseudomonas frederiksbergensis]|uniref:Uncharacterized protein n=1 Tax=Pseudomonas frederiksbergensis TaxID=104087 RepID=A0A1J0EQZ9_9PSED|nr:hypothetical protein [Pseudomonas frederiksbergensis]APC18578.1 hypothetical protein BLL42_23745 [Pseudomonas frederiksbergensis]